MSVALQQLAISLLACIALCLQLASSQRTFLSVTKSEISCSREESRVKNCSDDDCFLLEELRPNVSSSDVETEEWNRMARKMQELATDDRLDDTYPEGMHVMVPKSGLRYRVCPVIYTVMPSSDAQFPKLIMHARCQNDFCKIPDSNATNCKCKEVVQLRQVYKPLPFCTFNGKYDGGFNVTLLVKHFVNVSVNCEATKINT